MATIVSETQIGTYGSYTTEYAWLEGTELSRTDTSVTVRYTIYFKLAGSQTVFNDPIVATLTVNGVAQTTIQIKPQTSGTLYGNNSSQTWSTSQDVTTYGLTGDSCNIPVVCVYEDQVAPGNFSPKTISGNMPVSAYYYVETNNASVSGAITYPGTVKSVTVSLYKNGTYYTSTTTSSTSYSFTGLPVYSDISTGAINSYTVTFSTPSGFTQSQSGYNVTYTWTQTYTSISGTISWSDSANKTITVTLSNGSTATGTTSYSFTNLPVYSNVSTGATYSYSVSFPDVNGYTKYTSQYNVMYVSTSDCAWNKAPSYIYTNGMWMKAIAYCYNGTEFAECSPNIYVSPEQSQHITTQTNDYGTTAVINEYITETNDYGTTVVVG